MYYGLVAGCGMYYGLVAGCGMNVGLLRGAAWSWSTAGCGLHYRA